MKKRKSKKLRISLTIVALVEILTLIAVTTFSWIEGGYKGDVKSPDITITTGSDLTMYYGGNVENTITIPTCTLEETSSADGRNFFFPLAENTSNLTSDMSFREGTADDENQKYVSLDFDLVAGDSAADVYLGAGTIIRSSNADLMKALRMSFLTNDDKAPLVFSPTQMPGVEGLQYSPITSINENGDAATSNVNTDAYGDYYYKGDGSNALFHLDKGETKHITFVLWLEGTEFDSEDVANQDLSVYIEFTTTTDDLIKYNFIDNTHSAGKGTAEYWVANNIEDGNYATMMYIYDTDSDRYYAMSKGSSYDSDHTWTAYISNTVSNFTFRRYSIDMNKYWNQWKPSLSDIKKDKNGDYTYVAITDTETDLQISHDSCYGYWKDSKGTYRVFCEVQSGWIVPYCYGWSKFQQGLTRNNKIMTYPGEQMTYSHKNSDGNSMYYYDLYEDDNVTGIQFNAGYQSKATVRVDDRQWGNTKVYVWNNKDGVNYEYLGAWPGTSVSKVNGNLEVTFWYWTDRAGSTLGIKVSDNGNNASSDINTTLGNKIYKISTSNAVTTVGTTSDDDKEFNITDSQYFFNGMACWFRSNSGDKYGFYTYTGTTNNLIGN